MQFLFLKLGQAPFFPPVPHWHEVLYDLIPKTFSSIKELDEAWETPVAPMSVFKYPLPGWSCSDNMVCNWICLFLNFFFLVQIRNVLNRLYVSEHFVPNYPHCLGRIVEPRGNAGGREEGRLWCRTAWPHFLSTRFLAFWHGVLKSTSCTLGHAFSAIMDSMHLNGKPKETRSPLSCFSHDILSRNWHELWVIKKLSNFAPKTHLLPSPTG